VSLDECSPANFWVAVEPLDERDDDEGDENGESDGKKGEKLVIVQIDGNDALQRVRKRISLLLSLERAHRLDGEDGILKPGSISDESVDDWGAVEQNVESRIITQE